MKCTGVTARGIKLPIVKKGDDLVKIVADSLMEAVNDEGIVLNDKDIISVTESLLARSQGNFVDIKDVAAEINEKFKDADCIGVLFPVMSRNRFSAILKAIALTKKRLVVQLDYPADEMGNLIVTWEEIYAKNVNPYSDVLTEAKFREIFGYPVHQFTGVDYIKYYKELAGENSTIVLSKDARSILKYTKHVIPADVHTRFRTKKILLENGAKTVIGTGEILNKSINGSGYNEDYGLLGSNLSTDDTLKLFPRDAKKFVLDVQAELKSRTGKNLEVLVYGDGAFKDPIGGIWELCDPVVSPGFTDGLIGSPSELKLKYIADNLSTEGKGPEETRQIIENMIRTKDGNLVGKMASQGTTPRRYTDLIGSLSDLMSGSGDRGTPVILIQNYFSNYTN